MREFTFEQRCGIHDAANSNVGNPILNARRELFEPFVDQVVIVTSAPSVSRNSPPSAVHRARLFGLVVHCQHDDAARAFENRMRVLISRLAVTQVTHLTVIAGFQPGSEPRDSGRLDGGADTSQFEA